MKLIQTKVSEQTKNNLRVGCLKAKEPNHVFFSMEKNLHNIKVTSLFIKNLRILKRDVKVLCFLNEQFPFIII